MERSVVSIILAWLCLFLSACSDQSSSIGVESNTGSYSFHLVFPEDTMDAEDGSPQSPALDCAATGATITVVLFSSSNGQLTSGSWPCSAREGFLENIPAGSGYRAEFQGKDVSGMVIYIGEHNDITIRAGRETVGDVVMHIAPYSNSLGMTFRYISPGTFWMGSPDTEVDRGSDETRHQVTLTSGFYMQTTEVTQGQWISVVGSNPSSFISCGDNCPVEQVSWDDIQTFLVFMNQQGEGTYRLPTEAEWEYCARAGTSTPFNTGGCLSTDQSNYNGNYPYSDCTSGVFRATPIAVGSFAANAWGLYDMHGNVWEWCSDWYGSYSTTAVTDPTGPTSGTYRVLHGGSWADNSWDCRSADRDNGSPGGRSRFLGFRLVRTP